MEIDRPENNQGFADGFGDFGKCFQSNLRKKELRDFPKQSFDFTVAYSVNDVNVKLTLFTNITITEEPAGVADDDYSDDDNFGGDVDQDLFGKPSVNKSYSTKLWALYSL